MAKHYSLRDFDWSLMGLALVLAAFGVVEIFSATRSTPWQDAYLKQTMWVLLGAALLWMVSRIEYTTLIEHAPALYLGGVILLLVVLLFGDRISGSRRWLPLPGGLTLQVSEFMKVVLVLMMARVLSDLPRDRVDLWNLLKILGLFAIPILLVVTQPDLSTALSYVPILLAGLFLAGLHRRLFIGLVLAGVLVMPLAWRSLKPYQRERLANFLDPERDPQGRGYQPLQSKIAVGSGGIWGQGFARGSQTQLRFLPVPHTDFVFSAFAEEAGFIGVVVALSLYLSLVLKIVSDAQTAADNAGVLICMGVAALLLFHISVNVGMVIGQMPVTGLPLPLMSYGGSNVLATFLLLGLVNNVRLRRYAN